MRIRRFYDPDVFVACREDDNARDYRRFPNSIIEVLSETTARIDRRAKFLAYQTLESLHEYVLVMQDEPRLTVFRREHAWRSEELAGAGELVLPSLNFKLSLANVYEGTHL